MYIRKWSCLYYKTHDHFYKTSDVNIVSILMVYTVNTIQYHCKLTIGSIITWHIEWHRIWFWFTNSLVTDRKFPKVPKWPKVSKYLYLNNLNKCKPLVTLPYQNWAIRIITTFGIWEVNFSHLSHVWSQIATVLAIRNFPVSTGICVCI